MTERAENADFRRKPQIFAASPLLLEIQSFGGRRFSQETADFRRKPQIFAENRRNRRLGCVTFGPSPLARPNHRSISSVTRWAFFCGSYPKNVSARLHALLIRGLPKGCFSKRVVLANVPSFQFFVLGEHANVPSFRFSEFFVPGEHPNVPSFRFSFRGNIRQNHPFG